MENSDLTPSLQLNGLILLPNHIVNLSKIGHGHLLSPRPPTIPSLEFFSGSTQYFFLTETTECISFLIFMSITAIRVWSLQACCFRCEKKIDGGSGNYIFFYLLKMMYTCQNGTMFVITMQTPSYSIYSKLYNQHWLQIDRFKV